MGEGRRRARQVSRDGRNQADIAGNVPDLRTRRLLHGIDKRRQPAAVHATCPANPWSRCLKLPSHRRRIFPERRQPGIRRVVPANLPQRKCARCDLLHRGLFRAVVVVRNDPRTAPDDVGPAARPRDRLRPDRNRRGGRLDRAGFPHPGLRNRGQHRPRCWLGAAAGKRFRPRQIFANDIADRPDDAGFRPNPRQAECIRRWRIHTSCCVNRA